MAECGHDWVVLLGECRWYPVVAVLRLRHPEKLDVSAGQGADSVRGSAALLVLPATVVVRFVVFRRPCSDVATLYSQLRQR